MRIVGRTSFALLLALLMPAMTVVSCSTTSSLAEGELRLAENKIVVTNDPKYQASSLEPYLKQKANTYFIGKWNPFLYVYGWGNGSGNGWDKFCKKLGQAPVVMDSTLIGASVTNLKNHLEYQGYYDSEIVPSMSVKGKNVNMLYEVTLGKQFPLASIDVKVDDNPELESMISADSLNRTVKVGDYLSQETLEEESERISQYLRDNGYWGFTKNYFFYYADTTRIPGQADLFVRIRNHTRNESPTSDNPHIKYRIGNVSISAQRGSKIRQSYLESLNNIKTGDIYNEKVVNKTYERYSSVPLFNAVNVNLREVDSGVVDCRIRVVPGKIQGFKVNVEASTNSTGLIGIAPSLSYSHRNIFHGAETFTLGFKGNFQFSVKDKVRSNEFTANAGLSIPWSPRFFVKYEKVNIPRTELQASYSYQNRPEYSRHQVGGSYGASWNVARRLSFQINPVRAKGVWTTDMDPAFIEQIKDPYLLHSFKSHLDIGLTGNLYYTTSSEVNPKVSYFYTRFMFGASGNVLSMLNKTGIYPEDPLTNEKLILGVPYSQYLRGELQLVGNLKMGSSNQLALVGRLLMGAGYAYGNSITLPFEQLFYAGGASSLRGWQARSVGPGAAPRDSAWSIANQSGDMHLEANVELRFPIVWKLKGSVFMDAGNIWCLNVVDDVAGQRDPRSIFHFNDFIKTSALDWGAGLSLDFNVILVRFDLGMKLYDPREGSWRGPKQWFQQDGYVIQFGIGYPF